MAGAQLSRETGGAGPLRRLLPGNPNDYPLGYSPALDGLRGFVTLGVLTGHLFAWYPGGFLSIDTFFVLSGYLITSLLLRDMDRHGRVRFGTFYARRFLRLFPALYAMLAVFALAATFLSDTREHLRALLWAATYVTNWARAFDWGGSTYLGHTWSLAIEEQYYLAWPLLLACIASVFGVRWRATLVTAALALACMWWRVHLLLAGASVERVYNGFDTRADSLLIGCTLALFLRPAGALERVRTVAALRPLSVAVLALYVVLGFRLQWTDPPFYLYIGFACAVLTALLIATLLAHDDALAARMLRVWPLVYCGRISYGLYLWHFPVFVILRHELGLATAWTATLGIPLTFVLATLSYRYVETPFLRRKSRVGASAEQTSASAAPPVARPAAIARHET